MMVVRMMMRIVMTVVMMLCWRSGKGVNGHDGCDGGCEDDGEGDGS